MKTLMNEVEFLSKKNEQFLKELKTNDFYSVYRQQNEELTKLREAHALLINMIHSKDISVKKHEEALKRPTTTQSSISLGGFLNGQTSS